MKALIIGATGATGKDLVSLLLKDSTYDQVVIFVRRHIGITDKKLKEVITDFDRLGEVSAHINGDVLFSCLGTTLKAAGSKDKQWHIDYEIPLKFAEIARENEVANMVLLSAYGASAQSRVFYSKMKGRLEDAIEALAFENYIIFKPGMLLRKDTDRIGELVIGGMLKMINSIGLIRKFRPLPTSILAEKLAKAPKIHSTGKHVIELDKIFDY